MPVLIKKNEICLEHKCLYVKAQFYLKLPQIATPLPQPPQKAGLQYKMVKKNNLGLCFYIRRKSTQKTISVLSFINTTSTLKPPYVHPRYLSSMPQQFGTGPCDKDRPTNHHSHICDYDDFSLFRSFGSIVDFFLFVLFVRGRKSKDDFHYQEF